MDLQYFYRPLRIMLRDYDPSARQYPDAVLRDGVRTALQLNKAPGYTLTPDGLGVTPEFRDANTFALVTYHTARLFVAAVPDRRMVRTRGYGSAQGSRVRYLSLLEGEIHTLEN